MKKKKLYLIKMRKKLIRAKLWDLLHKMLYIYICVYIYIYFLLYIYIFICVCMCHIYLPFVFIYLKSHEFFEQSIRDVADLLAVRDFDVVPMWERERERETKCQSFWNHSFMLLNLSPNCTMWLPYTTHKDGTMN